MITTIHVGKHSFVITENQMIYRDIIYSHTFKIGGTYDDCISISYTYDQTNTPISAKIMFVRYEPECSLGNNLEKGGGTALMLQTILQYVFKIIPSIHMFIFEDMSHINCGEQDMSLPPPRKLVQPLNLAYLSIVYNSCTWYEKHFDAKMTDKENYRKYKHTCKVLTDPNSKVDFQRFLQIVKPPDDQIEYLREKYEQSDTYRDFFNSIPFNERCNILYPWLKTFIDYYFKGIYSTDWEIDVRTITNKNKKINGGTRRNRTKSNIFPSRYRIFMYNEMHTVR